MADDPEKTSDESSGADEESGGGGSKSSSKADPNDFGAIESAVNEAAKRLNAVWVTFILLMAYIFIATGKITHKDLFLETPVKLPVLGVDVPLLGYFVAAPVFVLAMHFYFLMQLRGLAAKFGEYDVALSNLPNIASAEEARLRHRIDNSLFAQILGGPQGAADVLLRFTTIASATALPMFLLCIVQLAFLPYQDENVTNIHRLLIFADSALITIYFVGLQGTSSRVGLWNRLRARRRPNSTGAHSECAGRSRRSISTSHSTFEDSIVLLPVVLVLAVPLFSAFVARIPGEHQLFPQLTTRFFGAEADPVHQRASSWFSNRLVLPDQNLIEGFDLDKVKVTRSLRGRHFVNAIFDRADLRKADFTGADLRFASLVSAKLTKAYFGCAYSNSARFSCVSLQEAYLDEAEIGEAKLTGANLNGASLNNANLVNTSLDCAEFGETVACTSLMGASLISANLERASLLGASLQGASLELSRLDAADLSSARLDGVSMRTTRLTATSFKNSSLLGGDFARATMFGAELDNARARDASFDEAELQGASLSSAEFSGTKFHKTWLYGTGVSNTVFAGSLIWDPFIDRKWIEARWDYIGTWNLERIELGDNPFGKEGDPDISEFGSSTSYSDYPQPHEIPISEDDRLRVVFPNGLPPDPLGKEIKERLTRLGPHTATADWTNLSDIKITNEAEYKKYNGEFEKRLGERLIIIACAKEGEAHVARGLMRSKRLCPYKAEVEEVLASGKMPDGRPCGDVENVKKAWSEMKGQYCPPEARH